MLSLYEAKNELRRELILRRGSFAHETYQMRSNQIVENCRNILDAMRVLHIHRFLASERLCEPDISEIDSKIQQRNNTVDICIASQAARAPQPTRLFDVILVPMLGFDSSCQRIGHGGGWYDRFLAQNPRALKIGVCFEDFKVAQVPRESHDIKLDYVVTEAQVYQSAAA